MQGRNFWWPNVESAENAAWAVKQAYWATVVCACVTGIAALRAVRGVAFIKSLGINGGSLLDAGVFAMIAIGLRRQSRAAAWSALLLYLVERLFSTVSSGKINTPIVSIVFVLAFIGGIRGANALHRLKRTPPEQQKLAA
jgi:hypothetical protein